MMNSRIVINCQDKVYIIGTSEIVYIKAKNSYSEFHLADGRVILSSHSIGIYERILTGVGFYRSHKSYVINVLFVKEVVRCGDIVLKDNTIVPIAKENIRKMLGYFDILSP